MDSLHRLAAIDTNIDALLGWRLVPHLQDGVLVIDGMDALDAENRAGLHVHWCGGRAGGEYMAYSLLQKFLAEQEGRLKALIKAHGDAA